MSGKRIYELTEKSGLENDYFMALDKSGTANAQKVNVSKILNPINNISGSADEYSSTKAYAVGDLVIHDNKLYKCTTACSAAAWSTNQGYFTQSTLTTELTNVKSSLSNIANIPGIGSEVLIGYTGGGTAVYRKRMHSYGVTSYADANNGRRRFTLGTIPNCAFIVDAKGRIEYTVNDVTYQIPFGETTMNVDTTVQVSSWIVCNGTTGTIYADVNINWISLTSIGFDVIFDYSKTS